MGLLEMDLTRRVSHRKEQFHILASSCRLEASHVRWQLRADHTLSGDSVFIGSLCLSLPLLLSISSLFMTYYLLISKT